MATHTNLPIYKVAYDLLGIIDGLVKNMHRDRAMLANTPRKRGHSIKSDLTKTYRKSA